MSIQALNWAMNQRLKPLPKLVLITLANGANSDGECRPEALELKTGMSGGMILRTLTSLEKNGFIRQTGVDGGYRLGVST